MALEAIYRGTVYPWQCGHACEITGVHMDRALRKSAAFAPDIREVAAKHVVAEPALA